jgi:hypothetical protein
MTMLLRCMSPLLALFGHAAMSAQRSLISSIAEIDERSGTASAR